MNNLESLQNILGNKVLENEPLSRYSTFKIGGPAKYFFIAENIEEIIKSVKAAKELGIKFYVIGGGSNILFADAGFDGLVIKIKNEKLKIKNYNSKFKMIEAEAGVTLSRLVEAAMEEGLTGLEWAAGIPGTVGGAVRGNAGAYGHAIGEVVEEVEALQIVNDKLQMTNYKNEECKFGYRESVFKHNKDIILKIVLKLSNGDKNKIKEEMDKILKLRGKKIPIEPSAGSFFKNVDATNEIVKTIKKYTHEDVPSDFIFKGKIPAAWLIERCGLKGKQIGGVKVSEKHSNFLINCGTAKAEEVIILASLIKMKVRDEFGIQLQEEVEYVGF
jgi:UDP-N-acetylmuramate dehydrogenase